MLGSPLDYHKTIDFVPAEKVRVLVAASVAVAEVVVGSVAERVPQDTPEVEPTHMAFWDFEVPAAAAASTNGPGHGVPH